MRTLRFAIMMLGLSVFQSLATTHFVSPASVNSSAPYTDWSTAATNIQEAIEVCAAGDEVLVTNGVYTSGGISMDGILTNVVSLHLPITVQSVNGPQVTVIQGTGMTNGNAAVRCAWLTNGAALIGFTLEEGATRISNGNSGNGGGVFCSSSNATVSNCILFSNTAYNFGAAAYQGRIQNCAINDNYSRYDVTYNSVLVNCTVVSNTGPSAEVYGGVLTNCIVYYNGSQGYFAASAVAYCCLTPLQGGSVHCITNAPQLFVDNIHLLPGSPCIGAGTNGVTGTDIDGQPWANPPSIGCSEWRPVPLVGPPLIYVTNNPIGFTASAVIGGSGPLSCWWQQNGTPLQDNGHFSGTATTNLVATGVSYADAGVFQLVVSNASGVVTSAVAQLVIHCVDAASTNPVPPYLNWGTASSDIQDAITASAPGDVVLVTNGVYATGGKSEDGVITNRASVDKAIIVQSMNGPTATVIQGAWDPVTTNGPGAVRCAWLTTNAALSGFTLTGGATRIISNGLSYAFFYGGGVFGPSSSAVVQNCWVATNYAALLGGGAYGVALVNCRLTGNHSTSWGLQGSTGGSGGGAAYCNLLNCLVTGNYAEQNYGGGAYTCKATNSAFTQNHAYVGGSGAYGGSFVNCTFGGNAAGGYPAETGGAVSSATLINCLVFSNYNTGVGAINYYNCVFSYSDTDPLPPGTGNIDVNPQLLGDFYHLAPTSPCLGAGTNSVTYGTDIDGQPWANPPAIGCDQWQPQPVIGLQPWYQVNIPPHVLSFNVVAAGQAPLTCYWTQNGNLLTDNGHVNGSSTLNLLINQFGPADAGVYQVLVSNAFGMVTSAVAQVVIHAVNPASTNPAAPYSSWGTAAADIQDAINVASNGDIVLVTNGVYDTGSQMEAGTPTRVAVNRPVTVTSVNGWPVTLIEGAWDPATTIGTGAVRCVYVSDGAVLNGFTLLGGATASSGTGGGVLCTSTNAIVSNCVLTNNYAVNGGGFANGTLMNSLVINNFARQYGGGAYNANLNNCTVLWNTLYNGEDNGAGTYNGNTYNSIVLYNTQVFSGITQPENYNPTTPAGPVYYYYSCTTLGINPTLPPGTGNTNNANPEFLDSYHIDVSSVCRGIGSSSYASGTDLDGEPWANPPSMGCAEVVVSNLVGPLSVNISAFQTNPLVNRYDPLVGEIQGRASTITWAFGDGTVATNQGYLSSYTWTNPGAYTVTCTAFNFSNPGGVSTNLTINVQPLASPQLQPPILVSNKFSFQFTGQLSANYTIEYATNLKPPVAWKTLSTIFYSSSGPQKITDTVTANTARFYRVLVQ